MSLAATLAVEADASAVRFALRVQNGTPDSVALRFPSAKAVDVVVRENGTVVWEYGTGRAFTQAVETATLEPGETATYRATWESPERGAYTAEASLTARGVAESATASFQVP
jgi:hypothetical protein